jgi:hypothetical protein
MASAPKESIKPILGNFTTLKYAKELFSELNYEVAQGAISRRQWGKAASGIAENCDKEHKGN